MTVYQPSADRAEYAAQSAQEREETRRRTVNPQTGQYYGTDYSSGGSSSGGSSSQPRPTPVRPPVVAPPPVNVTPQPNTTVAPYVSGTPSTELNDYGFGAAPPGSPVGPEPPPGYAYLWNRETSQYELRRFSGTGNMYDPTTTFDPRRTNTANKNRVEAQVSWAVPMGEVFQTMPAGGGRGTVTHSYYMYDSISQDMAAGMMATLPREVVAQYEATALALGRYEGERSAQALYEETLKESVFAQRSGVFISPQEILDARISAGYWPVGDVNAVLQRRAVMGRRGEYGDGSVFAEDAANPDIPFSAGGGVAAGWNEVDASSSGGSYRTTSYSSSGGGGGGYSGGGSGGGGGGGGGGGDTVTQTTNSTQTRVDLTNPTASQGVLAQAFRALLGRLPTMEEVDEFRRLLKAAERNRPVTVNSTTTATTSVNDDGTQQTTDQDSDVKQKGGVDAGVIAEQFARTRPDFAGYQSREYGKVLMAGLLGGGM